MKAEVLWRILWIEENVGMCEKEKSCRPRPKMEYSDGICNVIFSHWLSQRASAVSEILPKHSTQH